MEIAVTFGGGTKVEAQIKGRRIETDQPKEKGGEGLAPAPFDLFLASIATCAGFYVLDFCRTRSIPTDDIGLVMRTEYDPERNMIGRIAVEIRLPSGFPEKYRAPVVRAADLCSVKKHIIHSPVFDTYATVEGTRV